MVGLFGLLYGAALLCLDVDSHFKIIITVLFLFARCGSWVAPWLPFSLWQGSSSGAASAAALVGPAHYARSRGTSSWKKIARSMKATLYLRQGS